MLKTVRRIVALMMVAFLLCSCLTSCTEKPVDEPEISGGNDTVSGNEDANTPPNEEQPVAQIYDVGEETNVDLNGDGVAEVILVECVNDSEGWPRYRVSINDNDQTAALGLYFDNPDAEHFSIVDIDKNDSYLEIALSDDGPSSDPCTTFLRYQNESLSVLGQVYGKASDGDLTFSGDGTVESMIQLSVLQKWYASAVWNVGDSGILELVVRPLYYPVDAETAAAKMVAKDLAAYESMSLTSSRFCVEPGTEIKFIATDNLMWVQCETDGGEQFWLHLDETGQMVESYDGTYIWDGIDGLSIAG